MASLNALARSANTYRANNNIDASTTTHKAVHIQWLPLVILIIIVILIVGVILLPKTWMVSFNEWTCPSKRAKERSAGLTASLKSPILDVPASVLPSFPRRVFTLFSMSRYRAEQRRREEEDHKPAESQVGVHLQDIRGSGKP